MNDKELLDKYRSIITKLLNFIENIQTHHTCCLCKPECCIRCEATDLLREFKDLT